MSGWDKMRQSKENSGGSFIKLKDGDAVEGVFIGDPHCYYQIFKDKKEYASWVDGSSFRFKITFLQKVGKTWEKKIFQGGSTVRNDLVDIKEEYGLNNVFKIKRSGSGKEDTRYAILFKAKLTDAELAEIAKIHPFQFVTPAIDLEPPPFGDDDFPDSKEDI
jgi:hypothetical protein